MNIDSWQKGYAELSRQLANLKKENLEMKDELIKLRRTYEDQIDNLTLDNMPSVREIAIKTEDGVAGIVVTVDETVKRVEAIAANQTTQGDSIAVIRATSEQAANDANNAKNAANSAVSSVEILTETVTEQGNSIAAIEQTAYELGAEVAIAVEAANEANGKVSNGAYIIARVNEDGSDVKISADKVGIEGFVTFESLQAPGETTINGANIETGTLAADRIALNENGQIDFSKLGSLGFLTKSGASGEIRLNENEYGRGEIGISADMHVGISAGSASLTLNESPNYDTEMRVYANNFVMNGEHGLSGTFSLGNGSITVVNGIVVNVVEGGGGGGGDEPSNLVAPEVSISPEGYFRITNPNGVGTIHYYTYWYNDADSRDGTNRTSSKTTVTGYVEEFPDGTGYIGVYAHVVYNGQTSPAASDEVEWYA